MVRWRFLDQLGMAARRLAISLVGFGLLGSQIGSSAADDCDAGEMVGPLTVLQKRLVARFVVPAQARASEENPLSVEGEVVRCGVSPPYVLQAFVFVPVDPAAGPEQDPADSRSFRRLLLGRRDVFAPPPPGQSVMVFPDDLAAPVRRVVKPGDRVLVGIEAWAIDGKGSGSGKVDVDIKVKRVVNW